VLTTTGRNQPGIVARIATAIADQGGDILDISQTLVGDYFTMLLIVDIGDLRVPFADFQAAIKQVASELGIQAILMHEDLVSSLHRV
jgi:ACT domain-containing protein